MLTSPKLLFSTAAFLLPSIAMGQLTYGTDAVTEQDNFTLDIASGVSTGPVWTAAEAWGIADDESTSTYYVNQGVSLRTAPFGSMGAPATVIGDVTLATGGNTAMTGLVFNAGVLYGHRNIAVEGLYTIDLVTLVSTLVTPYATTMIDLGGYDVDPATGLLYASNDGLGYVDPQGATGRGIVTIDPVSLAEALIAPYPAGETDIDGLAFEPTGAGVVHLIEDEPAPLHRYDLATMMYDPAAPLNAIVGAELFSAGSYTGGSSGGIGTNYCMAAVNSTGVAGVMSATGSTVAASNNLSLVASNLPLNQFGLFVTSLNQDFVIGAGGTSNGNICLGGSIGRFLGAGQIVSSGASGQITITVDLTAIPQGAGTVGVVAGETWNYQAWYRDQVGLGSNFTDGLEITFQ